MQFFSLLIFISLFSISCSTNTFKKKEPVQVSKAQFQYVPITVEVYNGFAKKLIIPLENSVNVLAFKCLNKDIGFDRTDTGIRAYISVAYKYQDEKIECEVTSEKYAPFKVAEITVKKFPYKEEFLKVPKKHVDLSPESVKRWQRETAELKKVYENSIKERALFTEAFSRPLNSVVTSSYGKRRVFNNKKDSWHSGVDFRARTPTKIPSANRGKVVFTGHLFFNGKTVIVDHGLGIFTMYCHLSEITSEVGEIVPKGAIIGISGNTGRSNAPHLHWGVKVSGNWVNGLSLIDQGI